MMGEMLEEWENHIGILVYLLHTRKVTKKKKKVENYRGISLLNACFKLYSKILNEKLKTQAEKLLLIYQNGF
jgi:hypothetical protein